MARVSTTKAYDNKDVIIQINHLKDAVADLGQSIVIATEMPTAVAAYLDKVYLYIGDTDETYRENNIYKCVGTDGAYSWELMEVTAGTGATWGTIQGTLSGQTDLQAALDAKAAATEVTAHIGNTSNPHSVTKTQIGLGNCDNTADADKPISTATQTALDGKQPNLTADDNAKLGALPLIASGDAGKVLTVKSDESGYENKISGHNPTFHESVETFQGVLTLMKSCGLGDQIMGAIRTSSYYMYFSVTKINLAEFVGVIAGRLGTTNNAYKMWVEGSSINVQDSADNMHIFSTDETYSNIKVYAITGIYE